MTTLTQALARLRKLLDDKDVKKYDDTNDLTPALMTGQGEAWTCALGGSGRKYFKLTVAKSSSSSGAVDLSTEKPRKILSVSYVPTNSGAYMPVLPVRMESSPVKAPQSNPLSIVYLPDVSFPALAGDSFVWASASAMPSLVAQLDSLMIALAAAELKPVEGEEIPGLEKLIERKKAAVEDAIPSSSWTMIPSDDIDGRRNQTAPFGYIETGPHALQLVLR